MVRYHSFSPATPRGANSFRLRRSSFRDLPQPLLKRSLVTSNPGRPGSHGLSPSASRVRSSLHFTRYFPTRHDTGCGNPRYHDWYNAFEVLISPRSSRFFFDGLLARSFNPVTCPRAVPVCVGQARQADPDRSSHHVGPAPITRIPETRSKRMCRAHRYAFTHESTENSDDVPIPAAVVLTTAFPARQAQCNQSQSGRDFRPCGDRSTACE